MASEEAEVAHQVVELGPAAASRREARGRGHAKTTDNKTLSGPWLSDGHLGCRTDTTTFGVAWFSFAPTPRLPDSAARGRARALKNNRRNGGRRGDGSPALLLKRRVERLSGDPEPRAARAVGVRA